MNNKTVSLPMTSILLTGARMAGAAVGIVLQLVIARYYGPQILGNYYLALSLAAVLSIFLTLGYPWIVAPIVAHSQAQKEPEILRAFLYAARSDLMRAVMLLAIPIAAIIWLFADFESGQQIALLVGVVTAPVYAIMRMSGGLANAMRMFQTANLPELLLRPLFVLCAIGIALWFSFPLAAAEIIAINLVVTVALTFWMSRALPGDVRPGFTGFRNASSATSSEISKWRKLAAPMIFAILFINLFADLDLLLVGMILSAEQTGIFGVCIKVASLLAFAIQVTHQLLLRDASDAHLRGDLKSLAGTIASANLFAVATSLVALLLAFLFGRWVLGIFGPEFIQGYYSLLVLLVALVVRAAAGPAVQILMIFEHQRAGIPVYVVSIVFLILCNILLVPAFGLEGAAAAVLATTLLWTLWLNRVVKRETGLTVSMFGGSAGG